VDAVSILFVPLCVLQVEASDDTGGNVVSDISEKSHNFVYSRTPDVRQVRNFISDTFLAHNILDAYSYYISHIVCKIRKHLYVTF